MLDTLFGFVPLLGCRRIDRFAICKDKGLKDDPKGVYADLEKLQQGEAAPIPNSVASQKGSRQKKAVSLAAMSIWFDAPQKDDPNGD